MAHGSKLKKKQQIMKTTVQLIAAIGLCFFGLALMIVSFIIPPPNKYQQLNCFYQN